MTSDDFKNNPIFSILQSLEEAIKKIEVSKLSNSEKHEILLQTYSYVAKKLNNSNSQLIHPNTLDSIKSKLEGSLSQLTSYFSDNNESHIDQAINQLYSAVNTSSNLPEIGEMINKSSFNEIIKEGQSTYHKFIGEVKETNKSFNSELKNIGNQINEFLNKFKSFDQQYEQQVNELNALESELNARYSKLEAEFRNENQNKSSTQKKEFDELVSNFKKESESISAEIKKTSEISVEEIEKKSNEIISYLNEKSDEAQRIVGAITNSSLTGLFNRTANSHHWSAEIFRGIALFFMVAMVTIVIFTLFNIGSDGYDWKVGLIRILGASILSFPATYAAKESTKHRNLENKNRKIELELATLNPYVELLPEEEKVKIKIDLVQKYFGNQQDYSEKESSDNISQNFLIDIFKQVGNMASKFK